jgi:hypothetical protein
VARPTLVFKGGKDATVVVVSAVDAREIPYPGNRLLGGSGLDFSLGLVAEGAFGSSVPSVPSLGMEVMLSDPELLSGAATLV